jgi:hypothetical protein
LYLEDERTAFLNSLLFFSDAFYPNDLGEIDPSRQPFARNYKTFLTEFLKSEFFTNNLVHKVAMLETIFGGDIEYYKKQKTRYNLLDAKDNKERFKHDSNQPASLDSEDLLSNKEFLIQKDKNLDYQKLRKEILIKLHQVYLKKLAPKPAEVRSQTRKQTVIRSKPESTTDLNISPNKESKFGSSKGIARPSKVTEMEITPGQLINAMREAGVSKLKDADLEMLIKKEQERQGYNSIKDMVKNLFVNTKLGDGKTSFITQTKNYYLEPCPTKSTACGRRALFFSTSNWNKGFF